MTLAFWCVLVAGLMPFLFTGIAKLSGPGFDNRRVRDFQATLTGFRQRAHWAHLNTLEAFPLFAAAVIIAQIAGADQDRVDLLAGAFVLLRLFYGGAYMADLALLRSLIWVLALGCVVALFAIAV